MKRSFFGFLAFTLLWSIASLAAPPSLRSGDIVFQTSASNQANAIMWATNSPYSHVGLIEVASDGKAYVLEAIAKVSRTPLDTWTKRGRGARYSVYRYDGLTPREQGALVRAAKTYLGRGYDIYFTSQNKEIYCSELIDLAFQKTGLAVGRVQKIKELNVDNPRVRELVKKRWRGHPLCRNLNSFDLCWSRILNDELVTPASISQDRRLTRIWSNY